MPSATRPAATDPTDDPVRLALSDARTLEDLRTGVRVLLRRVRPGVSRTALADLAEDVLSRTAQIALSSRFDAARGPSVAAWLYGIARMIVRKETSGRRRRTVTPTQHDWAASIPDPVASPDEQVIAQSEAERLREALAQLDQEQRRLLEMHYFDGQTAADIGARLSVAPATIRVRLHRARKAAEALLDPQRGEANP